MPDIQITLTQFIDFSVRQQGVSRVNYVRRIKQQPEYHPAWDFWKQLRDALREMHSRKLSTSVLDDLISSVHPKKRELYTQAVAGYKNFLKKKEVAWFDPGKSHWSTEDLLVRTSPELGLLINGQPHLLKLYFKGHGETATKRNIAVTLAMLSESQFERPFHSGIPSVMSTAQSKLFTLESALSDSDRIALAADAQQFVFLWNQL
ncbi:hypothetical protein LLE49_23680 [Alicyclobacillus tolerans]|uniref:hypothetical protein n=1 Tax=Alicyclobacillus tolerans TaxID=90970 RepID=UPI001F21B89D|nr:hypothetical protein [Alicyclobacillus tolerans]MCF8567725.1 hypothetical protein [Alicyclobacillus tolerans]